MLLFGVCDQSLVTRDEEDNPRGSSKNFLHGQTFKRSKVPDFQGLSLSSLRSRYVTVGEESSRLPYTFYMFEFRCRLRILS